MSWYYFLSTLLLVVTAFYGTYALAVVEGKIVCGLLAGLPNQQAICYLPRLSSDAILQKSPIARLLMNFIGLLTLAPASIWREPHQHHHNQNSRFLEIVVGGFQP